MKICTKRYYQMHRISVYESFGWWYFCTICVYWKCFKHTVWYGKIEQENRTDEHSNSGLLHLSRFQTIPTTNFPYNSFGMVFRNHFYLDSFFLFISLTVAFNNIHIMQVHMNAFTHLNREHFHFHIYVDAFQFCMRMPFEYINFIKQIVDDLIHNTIK